MKGAIFDMDGVLFDTEALWQICWQKAAKERGITLPDSFRKDICGSSEKMPAIVSHYYHTDQPLPLIQEVYENLLKLRSKGLPEKAGIHTVLPALRKMGFKIAVASSSTKEMILQNLKEANIEIYFNEIISGQEVQHGKPAPDIFLLAAERLKLPAEECYVFEDAYNGIRAASAAKTKPVMVVDLSEPDGEMEKLAHFITYSLEEALEKMKEEM